MINKEFDNLIDKRLGMRAFELFIDNVKDAFAILQCDLFFFI